MEKVQIWAFNIFHIQVPCWVSRPVSNHSLMYYVGMQMCWFGSYTPLYTPVLWWGYPRCSICRPSLLQDWTPASTVPLSLRSLPSVTSPEGHCSSRYPQNWPVYSPVHCASSWICYIFKYALNSPKATGSPHTVNPLYLLVLQPWSQSKTSQENTPDM